MLRLPVQQQSSLITCAATTETNLRDRHHQQADSEYISVEEDDSPRTLLKLVSSPVYTGTPLLLGATEARRSGRIVTRRVMSDVRPDEAGEPMPSPPALIRQRNLPSQASITHPLQR